MERHAYEKVARRLGGVLAAEREAAGLTQRDLVEHGTIGLKFISMMEKGDANPSLLTFINFCEGIGADPVRILQSVNVGNGRGTAAIDRYVELAEDRTMRKVLQLATEMSPTQRKGLLTVARTITGN